MLPSILLTPLQGRLRLFLRVCGMVVDVFQRIEKAIFVDVWNRATAVLINVGSVVEVPAGANAPAALTGVLWVGFIIALPQDVQVGGIIRDHHGEPCAHGLCGC